MDTNEEVTWVVTKNTVADRMIESSLVHKFSNSKKFLKSTRLLNKLIEKYRNLNRYQDYVQMKKLIKQKIGTDIEVEDDESFGEDDYSILHKINVTCKNDIKKTKNTISNETNSTLIPSISNEIEPSNMDLPKENRKRVRVLQVNDKNDSGVPVKKKRVKNSKQCLKNIETTHPIINGKNSSSSSDINNINVLLEESINHTEVVIDTKDSSLLTNNTENKKQINNFTHKIQVIEDTISKPDIQTNHLQSPDKHSIENNIHQHLTDTENNEVIDHFDISNVNCLQEIHTKSHNTKDIVEDIESTSHDIKEDLIIKKQNEVLCNSNIMNNNMNLNDITKENLENDVCSHLVVLQSQKSPPKVKFTEIINKKYKIINRENSCNELSSEFYNNMKEEWQENGGYASSISNNVLSQSEKRIKQLKRLNLSVENTSSSSEDETLHQKDNLNEINMLNNSLSKTKKKKVTWDELKLNRSHDVHHKNDSNFHDLEDINNSTNHKHNKCTKDLIKPRKISSKNIKPEVETLAERPCNLENFIKEEELVQDKSVSAFALPDLSKDEEIFVMDMPITVQLADLQGQKIILQNKLLKLGKNKYEILYKNVPPQSCVFSTCKDSEPHKIINVKPEGSIIVKRKFLQLSVPTYSKHDTKSYHHIHKRK